MVASFAALPACLSFFSPTASLTILLVSGTFATLLLWLLIVEGTYRQRGLIASRDCGSKIKDRKCGLLFAGLLAAPFGMSGLAPVVTATLMLYQGRLFCQPLLTNGAIMKLFKALEVVFEALPQSILQAYVVVAYGRLNPSDSEHFSRLLCFSISISLLGAGTSGFNFEGAFRNQGRQVVRTGSRYGIATILLRTCQTGMLVFWIALMACAEKGYAIYAVVASLIIYIGAFFEAGFRGDGEVEVDGNFIQTCFRGTGTFCGLGRKPMPRAFLWNTLPLLIAGTVASIF
jgi:hypothetical protein